MQRAILLANRKMAVGLAEVPGASVDKGHAGSLAALVKAVQNIEVKMHVDVCNNIKVRCSA